MNYNPSDLSVSKLLFSIVVFSLAYYFSNPATSDKVFNFALLAFMACSLKNKDLLSTLALIAMFRLLIELGWFYQDDTTISKTVVYCSAIGVASVLFYDKLARVLLVVLGITIASEIYWWSIGYDAPGVYWGVLLSAVMLLHRHMFLFRAAWLRVHFKSSKFKSSDLDFYIFTIATIQFFIYSLSNVEYLIRHIARADFTFFYNLTPHFIHGLNLLLFVLLFNAAIKEINLHLFHA